MLEAAREQTPPPAADVPTNPRTVALVVLAVLAVVAALKLAAPILIPVALAVLISYPLDPLVALLQRARIPRPVGAALLVAVLFGGIGAGAYALGDEAQAFVDQLPSVAHRVGQAMKSKGGGNPVGKVQEAAGELEKAASAATRPSSPPPGGIARVEVQEPPLKFRDYILSGSMGALGLAAQIVIVVFLALYLLASGDLFKRKLVKLAGPSLSSKKITLQILQDIDRQISLFLLVRAAVSIVVGTATWVGLEMIGLRHAVLWGVAAGVMNTVPYIGPVVIAAAVAVVGFLQFGTAWMALAASGITVFVTSVEGYWLTPWLTSRAAKMNAVSVFVGLLFWGWLWGIWGMLLAAPLMMVTKAVCDRIEDLKPFGELLGE